MSPDSIYRVHATKVRGAGHCEDVPKKYMDQERVVQCGVTQR